MTHLLGTSRHRPVVAAPVSAQSVYETVLKALPGSNVTSIIFPSASFSNPGHYLVWTNGNTALTARLFTAALVDATTGRLAAVARMPWYLRALQFSRPLHFGDYGGLPMQVAWAALNVVTLLVLGSGLYLWVTRRRTRAARIGRPAHSHVPVGSAPPVPWPPMPSRTRRARQPRVRGVTSARAWFVWRTPLALAAFTVFGLLGCLLGTGAWQWAAWIALALPLTAAAWFAVRPHRARSRTRVVAVGDRKPPQP
jgi:hypothetical protein